MTGHHPSGVMTSDGAPNPLTSAADERGLRGMGNDRKEPPRDRPANVRDDAAVAADPAGADVLVSLAMKAGDVHLRAIGEVFVPPMTNTSKPVVPNVVVRTGAPDTFRLAKGKYEYQFHVEGGRGSFTLEAKDDNDIQLGADEFDTKYGFAGKVLPFEVK